MIPMKLLVLGKVRRFFGQDAQYQETQMAFEDNHDGTVTDLNTGLMWIKDVDDKVNYYDVIDTGYSYASYDDWRIPTIKELYSLMNFKGIDPDPTRDRYRRINSFYRYRIF